MNFNTPSKISIITPSFNQDAYIDQTIQSVLKQNYPDFEHIVIDGGSTDRTVQILKSYEHLVWISEKDRGQADALNKGLRYAKGDVIGWINSDDYYESNIFKFVMDQFYRPETQWVIGNLTYQFDGIGTLIPNKSPVVSYERLIRNPDIVKQAPAFFRRSFLERVGGWNPDFFMVMDFDLWVRLSKCSPPKMVDHNWAYFRIHSMQKTSISNTQRQLMEIVQVLKRESVPLSITARVYTRKQCHALKSLLKNMFIEAGLCKTNLFTL
ncbi:MAG: glycosyltransferase family 2 protein [Geobacteraceae bacterium]|nr:glycosyltransferase family 2 protein [Geobacteraceae bacterium]